MIRRSFTGLTDTYLSKFADMTGVTYKYLKYNDTKALGDALNNKKVDFVNCEMIGKHTENLCQYVTKGKQILVEGELNIDNYEKDGEKRSFTKVKVDRLEFLGGVTTEKKTNTDTLEFTDFQEVDNDDIPF